MISSTPPAGRDPLVHHLVVKQSSDIAWVMALLVLLTAVVGAIVATFTTVTESAWEIASGIPRWIVGGWGVYVAAVYLPEYIAHGYTRREFARRAPALIAVVAPFVGLVIAAGYAVERLVYRAFDWPHGISASLLYDAPTQFHLVAIEHAMVHAAWLVVGILLGAAFYRGEAWGLVAAPVGVGTLVLLDRLVSGSQVGPFGFLWGDIIDLWLPLSLLAYVVTVAGCAALAWRTVRDLPLRPRNT